MWRTGMRGRHIMFHLHHFDVVVELHFTAAQPIGALAVPANKLWWLLGAWRMCLALAGVCVRVSECVCVRACVCVLDRCVTQRMVKRFPFMGVIYKLLFTHAINAWAMSVCMR